SLTFQSVQDLGGGKGTFVGVYQDTRDGVSSAVSGSLTFKGMAPDPVWNGPSALLTYDFGVTFSGSATHVQWNPRTDIRSSSVSRASGSGDVYVTGVSGNASDYTNVIDGLSYAGTESDSFTYSSPYGGYTLREGGPVWYTDFWYVGWPN